MQVSLFTTLLLVGAACAAPPEHRGNYTIVGKDFYPEEQVVYEGKHDIVNIFLPVSFLKLGDRNAEITDLKPALTIYFAEADIAADGKRTYHGLYTLKDGKAKKILDNGVDAAASRDDSSAIYIAATDGIYKYSPESQAVEKYGSVSDNVIGIAHEDVENVLYILTADHSVYRVTENGNKKEKLQVVEDAQEIVLDHSGNLFYTNSDKKVSIYRNGGMKQLAGPPELPSRVNLFRSPIVFSNGVVCIWGNKSYFVDSYGTFKDSGVIFKDDGRPTSYNTEGALFQYFGINKKIYAIDISDEETNLNNIRDYIDDTSSE